MSAVSFRLGSFIAGGGLPEGDYLLTDHGIVLWDYDGKMANNTLAFKFAAQPGKVSGKNFVPDAGEPIIQHYSIGDPNKFGPDEKGTGIVAVGTATSLGKGSNFFIYLENLVNAGFPEDRFENDVSVFDGMVVHITPIPAPKRNLPQSNLVANANQGPERERTIPVVSIIHKLPWDKAGAAPAKPAAGKPAAAATKPAAAAATTDEEPADILVRAMGTILNGKDTMPRTMARVSLFKQMGVDKVDNAKRDAVMKLFSSDDDLGAALASVGDGYYVEGTDIKKIG